MKLPDRIEGDRLLLREWTADDADALAATIASNIAHLRPWMPWIAHEPLGHSERAEMIQEWRRGRLDGGDAIFGVFFEGAAIGGCGLHRRCGPHGLELGYWIDIRHTRHGFATDAASLLTTAALAVRGVTFVEIHHDRANLASRGVAERLGYRFVGETSREAAAPGEVGIECTWRVDAASWGPSRV